jgi:hypothetical protein
MAATTLVFTSERVLGNIVAPSLSTSWQFKEGRFLSQSVGNQVRVIQTIKTFNNTKTQSHNNKLILLARDKTQQQDNTVQAMKLIPYNNKIDPWIRNLTNKQGKSTLANIIINTE